MKTAKNKMNVASSVARPATRHSFHAYVTSKAPAILYPRTTFFLANPSLMINSSLIKLFKK
jgi:hypothetical protein